MVGFQRARDQIEEGFGISDRHCRIAQLVLVAQHADIRLLGVGRTGGECPAVGLGGESDGTGGGPEMDRARPDQ